MSRSPVPRRLLVAGATGWLGRTLFELARQSGFEVVGVARHPDGVSGIEPCDVSRPDAVDRLFGRLRPFVVFNCVRVKSDEFFTADRRRSNDGLRELRVLLDASARYRSRLVHVGSAAEYGGSLKRRPVTERVLPHPLSLYGRQKVAQTKLALTRAQRGVDVIVARLFNLIGPGEGLDTVTGSWIARLASRKSENDWVSVPATVRDFLDIRDAVRALLLLGTHEKAKGMYNACSGRGTRIDHVVRVLARILSVDVRVRAISPARVDGSGPTFAIGSSQRLRRLGWAPRIPLERSIIDLVTEWCDHGQ